MNLVNIYIGVSNNSKLLLNQRFLEKKIHFLFILYLAVLDYFIYSSSPPTVLFYLAINLFIFFLILISQTSFRLILLLLIFFLINSFWIVTFSQLTFFYILILLVFIGALLVFYLFIVLTGEINYLIRIKYTTYPIFFLFMLYSLKFQNFFNSSIVKFN